jgi:hypothetical protein
MKHWLAFTLGLVLTSWLSPAPAHAAPAPANRSAHAFAERLVRSLNVKTGGPGDWEHLGRHGGYDPSFIALMDENDKLAQGVDLLDADPLCACQDTGGHYVLAAFSQGGPDQATARITGGGEPVTATLKKTSAGWRVYDVTDASGSFRARLIRHNDCMRRYKTDADQVRCFGDK